MKFSTKTEDTFKPITISIVIESPAELEVIEAIGLIDESIPDTVIDNYDFSCSTQEEARRIVATFYDSLRKIVG